MKTNLPSKVAITRIRPIVEREMAKRADGGDHDSGLYRLVSEIAAELGVGEAAIARRLYTIRNGRDTFEPRKPTGDVTEPFDRDRFPAITRQLIITGRWDEEEEISIGEAFKRVRGTHREVSFVELDTVDRLLIGMGLQDLWRTELADILEASDEEVPTAWCPTCEEWTLGRTCAWCDTRTVVAERMVERKARGNCQICGRKARGQIGSHRLCGKHEYLWMTLGVAVERRAA